MAESCRFLVCSLLLLTIILAVYSQTLNQHRGPWQVVFKIPFGKRPTGYASIMDFWKSTGSYNDASAAARNDFLTTSEIFKSSILDNWLLQSISAVRVSAYKNNKEQAYIVFDAMGKDKNNWMDCNNVLSTSYTDLTSKSKNYCAFYAMTDTIKRQVFVNEYYGGCDNDYGWFMLKDYDATAECPQWDVIANAPYFFYSAGTTSINWKTGNRQTADSFVVSVLAWDMVFKGVEGVVPPQGSLVKLWQGTDLSNDGNVAAQSLTWNPGLIYKSHIVENWVKYPGFFIESVKYAYYTNGLEVAYTVFDARNTDKNGWFDISNILYSYYKDIKSYSSMAGSSIVGDGTRAFALHKEWGGCPNDKAWMEILDDPNGGTPCSWDQNVRKRPYFLYSNTGGWALCQYNNAWNQAQFPSAEVLAVFVKGWKLVFKVANGQLISPASSMYDLWTGTYSMNEGDSSAVSFAAGTKTLKSSIIDQCVFPCLSVDWTVFDANGADKNSWFDKSRLIYTTWNDLSQSATTNFLSIDGDASGQRRFFMQMSYGGCAADAGWMVAVERISGGCGWELRSGTKPYFLYSDASTAETEDGMAMAEVFAISVDIADCIPNPCQNGAACTDEGLTFSCTCSGNWIGFTCSDRNGGFTDWTAWGSCSVTCETGTVTRTRTCTNPTPVGAGAACSGATTETASCTLLMCPINGGWGTWATWSSCSVTCETGTRSRSRACDSPAPKYGGTSCSGNNTETEPCTLPMCPINGNWGAWSSWGTCSVTCETGTWTRQRLCNNPTPQYNGANCAGVGMESATCTLPMCPIDGQWASWESWGTCSVTCETGSWGRSRTCTNPSPQYGGANCVGSSTSTGTCTLPMCPIDGQWSAWSNWATCSVTCGGGSQGKTRSCTNPAPQYGGAVCTGDSSQTQQCNTQVCIIDGAWSAWGSWGACSVTCGGGKYSRSRTCSNPAPANGGLSCSGDSSAYGDCNTAACPTAAAGTYVQLCPAGWFTCKSGSVSCIERAFACDCSKECSDGSDETEIYAGCSATLLAACPSEASGSLKISLLILGSCVLTSLGLVWDRINQF